VPISRPVLDAERVPRQREWERDIALEEPDARDGVVGRLELEEERLAAAQDAELSAPRLGLPEIDLVQVFLAGANPYQSASVTAT
jgi:hypothetical protein